MGVLFDEVEKQARSLSMQEKALLARILVEELDPETDLDIEELWVTESQRRYAGYLDGTIEAHAGDDVMARVRRQLG
ncbi:hypothetical protein BH10ACI2_BH10ACI2_26330 [soil metagenome]